MKKQFFRLFAAVTLLSSCTGNIQHSSDIFSMVYTRDNVPASFFSIASDKDTVISGKSGTKIRISKNTFVDSEGKSVHGIVKIELKEAIKCSDIVLGNMTTLSDGRILQSGGMIYLNATSENENLSIAENRSIEVSVPTDSKNESMQIYSAAVDSGTNQLNWVNPQDLITKTIKPDSSYHPVRSMRIAKKILSDTIALTHEDVNNLVPPQKPQQYDSNSDTTISLIFDTLSFPELAQYRNVKFKLRDNKNFNPADSKRIWMSIDLKKTEEEGIYIISFSCIENNNIIERSYKVTPVFEAGSDYKTAMIQYDKKFEAYENKKADLEAKRIANEKRLKQEELEAEARLKRDMEQQKLMEAVDLNYYVFPVKQIGGWSNIDCLYSGSNCRKVDLFADIKNQNDFENIYISMILEKEKIFLPGYHLNKNVYGFSSDVYVKPILPIGSTATIIVTALKNDKPYLAIKKITIDERQNVSFQLEETTIEKLKSEIKEKI